MIQVEDRYLLAGYGFEQGRRNRAVQDIVGVTHPLGPLVFDADTLYAMTVGEYFEWKKSGKASTDLVIDPDADLLQRPQFGALHHANN